MFIDNADVNVQSIPDNLDREYYIEEAKKRIDMFLNKKPEKIDDTPNILFNCMNNGSTFVDFLEKCVENKVTKKVLLPYLTADCCSKYGKTKKLLIFKDYFDIFNGKNKITVSTLDKKIKDDKIKNIIISNSELSKTGKSYNNLDSRKALLEIFNLIPDEHLNAFEIMEAQVKKFDEVRYVDPSMHDKLFILNTRNVIAPNLVVYDIGIGEYKYVKVKKEIFKILPLQDGDIIDAKKIEKVFGEKIIGKDDDGKNIVVADIDKEYDMITQYDIIFRKYKKSNSLITDCEVS